MARWDKRPQAFSFQPKDDDDYRIVEENMKCGKFKSFSEMNRRALKALNEQLTNKPMQEATA